MEFTIKTVDEFEYIDEGEGKETLLLLHGLFGALSNWDGVIEGFRSKYRVIIPLLPIYTMPMKSAGIPGLVKFVEKFVETMSLKELTLIGNSLGGHLGLVYTLNNPGNVKRLILTGSSGLFENSMGASFPKRGNYDFVEERVRKTFYDPNTATRELIDHVFQITKSLSQCLRIVSIAKSAQRHNMSKDITSITVPTMLIWGLNDTITPPLVGHEFNGLIPNSELRFIDKCGHAPMMEHPGQFNAITSEFILNNEG